MSAAPHPGTPLTAREVQVLAGVAAGKSNAEIGAEMFLSEHTVRAYLRHLFQSLGATSRANAVYLGMRSGAIT